MDYAMESVEQLKKMGHKLYIISFCGRSRAIQTKNGLDFAGLSDFFNDQFYVKNREDKKYVCKYLGCDIMIDDREGILNDIMQANPKITTILFGSKPSNKSHKFAQNWHEVLNIINYHSRTEVIKDPTINLTMCRHIV